MKKVNETAAGGSTGAGSIATVPSNRLGAMQSRMSLKDFMVKFHSKVNNRGNFKAVPPHLTGAVSKINETAGFPYQLDDATSRLKSIQQKGEHDDKDIISYGVQDDTGNMMIVTVPLQQSEEFEQSVAMVLADVLEYKKTGKGENKTLAELLYELKDHFTIVDVQFPNIPSDAVYNADDISKNLPEAEGMGDEEMGMDAGEGDMDMGDEEMDMDAGEGDMGMDDEKMDMDDEEVGSEFGEEEDKESLLTAVLGMLKSQNEKETAQAEAEAEKARARQAELALRASKEEMKSQEEMVSVQAEMDAEKEKEKRAKEMANLAKFNYKKKKGLGEGFSPIFKSTLLELDSADTTTSLRRQMGVIPTKYKTEPGDDPETVKFKREQQNAAMRELRIKMNAARSREKYDANLRKKEDQLAKDQQTGDEASSDQSNIRGGNQDRTQV